MAKEKKKAPKQAKSATATGKKKAAKKAVRKKRGTPTGKTSAKKKTTRGKTAGTTTRQTSRPSILAHAPEKAYPVVRSVTRGGAASLDFWEDTESTDADGLGDDEEFEFVPVADFREEDEGDAGNVTRGGGQFVGRDQAPTLPPELQRCIDKAAGPTVRGRIGAENRKQIGDPRQYPFSAVCSLEMRVPGKLSVGTGWLVGRNLVLTAGHNLLHNPIVGRPTEVRVYPGRNGRNGIWPGVQEIAVEGQFWVSDPWRLNQDKTRDWGMIILKQPLYEKAGSFGLVPWENSRILDTSGFMVLGYPSSKASDSPNPSAPFTLWYDVGKVTNVGDRTLLYRMDTSQGESGAPLLAYDNSRTSTGNMICLGIHNWSTGGFNQATRVTPSVIRQVEPFLK